MNIYQIPIENTTFRQSVIGSREAASEGPTVSIAYATIPSSNEEHQPRYDNSTPYMGVRYIYRDTEQPQQKEPS